MAINESALRQKRDRSISSKDSVSRKRKTEQSCPKNTPEEVPHFTQEEVMGKLTLSKSTEEVIVLEMMQVPEKTIKVSENALIPDNEEIYILYTYLREMQDMKETVINDVFAFAVATEVSKNNGDNDT